ncbi:uncharacterized protein LOC109598828 [Aethina tumida]|uniref:uncharacterized protein LOC109598828 n=1 Tax=Aethina tumida TaxID=116153 RepID=UPI0021486F05|nr:uncharacterized protein LOC109598828 [Aethina tumida]
MTASVRGSLCVFFVCLCKIICTLDANSDGILKFSEPYYKALLYENHIISMDGAIKIIHSHESLKISIASENTNMFKIFTFANYVFLEPNTTIVNEGTILNEKVLLEARNKDDIVVATTTIQIIDDASYDIYSTDIFYMGVICILLIGILILEYYDEKKGSVTYEIKV